jgi:hypothetical protein
MISGYFGTTVRVFPERTGFCHQVRRWDLQSLDFVLVDFKKITSVTNLSF